MALNEAAYRWEYFARPKQLAPPGDRWLLWLVLAGRGFGKTRTGAEWVRDRVENQGAKRIVIAAPTAADVRDIAIEGESGLLSVFPPHRRPHYEPSKRRITFSTGAVATLLAAEKPDRFRGVQSDTIWAEELSSWRFPDAWDQLMLGFRLGEPRGIITTTPKPQKLIRDLLKDPATVTTRGSTFDNRDNLAPAFLREVTRRYEGTRLGRQELHAELLDAVEGALVSSDMIEAKRVEVAPEMRRVVIGVDPAATSGEDADETGIVVAGLGRDGEGYVLADRSLRESPDGWGRAVVRAFDEFDADRVVAEKNNGGEMVEHTLRTVRKNLPVQLVTATKGKHIRFEPVGALYEQGRIHHVGTFGTLEDQVCSFTLSGYEGGDSPDHADAAVWAIWSLMVKRRGVSPSDLYGGAEAA